MATPTPKPAVANPTLMARLSGTEVQPTDEDLPEVEEAPVEAEPAVDDTDDVEEAEESTDDSDDSAEISPAVKEILKKNRKAAREKEAENAELKKRIAELENPDAASEAPVEQDTKYKDLFIKTAAKSALAAAGFDKSTERFLKMIDLDELTVDDDGNIEGLEDQVSDLKREWADVLTPKAPVKKRASSDAAPTPAPTAVKKSSASKLTEKLGL